MSVNIVLIAKNRKRLTSQCLKSLYANTPNDQFRLTIVDDGSRWPDDDLSPYDELAVEGYDNWQMIHVFHSIGIVGWLRNVGASASERYFGRGEWLYFSDCDVAFFPNWLPHMIHAMKLNPEVRILGGCRHPFHGVNGTLPMGNGKCVEIADAVAGYSLMMQWRTYDEFGPFASTQKGVGASEDWMMSRQVVQSGAKVGYLSEPVLAHTGLTNTDGKPATGADSFKRVEGILYE
jgi:hypothetical protein